MPWIFQQSTGKLMRNGVLVGTGYAGKNEGKNNPHMQTVPNIGPLPRGEYKIIGHPFHHPHTGNYSIRLEPKPTTSMYGRSGFLIHGDSASNPGGASSGCIVLPFNIRHQIWNSGDRDLEVTQ
ncbi:MULTISPECIES: tlde1 domain-containing protein [unclassified Pseudomonas]|nr:DUF2778 domain-containing protein [Pseudomonas sp. UMA643]NTY21968.1 DUF2778 domain-containing protein [Pseudomonas sp. UMC3103]NTY28149.1 DUF2778 domain-containing protein [Pseudomonas sp. UMA603]NTY31936.1 DUF2778 domain-containing protein [Pseudomonas sp. UMC3129]NTY55645.1 DUF2778 domain-containing protein [Pseudomonas sp. UMC631]NTY69227.1 DUF2778 domain-containing protein [Pseudomonas sp. UMC3106]NUA36590.1 DUF2778 domain-containing protein [Pseudomonas sp. UMA601]